MPSAVSCVRCNASIPPASGDTQASPARDFQRAAPYELLPSNHDVVASEVERRHLTILFCDLVASTALSSRLDPEDLREVIGAYHHCVAKTVEPLGGFVARYTGDGALVYFGYPQAFEDSAARAVRAALALIRQVAELDAFGQPLSARIGIATGVVVVGELVNARAAHEQTALGETPNLAARLQSFADPDTIVIADTTRRLVGELFDLKDLGAVELKGFSAPAHAWKVLAARRVDGRVAAYNLPTHSNALDDGRGRSRALLGRDRELTALFDRWHQSRGGHGRAVLLTGEPGIGKSRLVQTFAARLAAEAHYELEFHCSPYYAHTPLYPVVTLLPRVVGWSRADSEQAKLDKLETFCTDHGLPEQAFPLFATLLALRTSDHVPVAGMSAERRKQHTLEALLRIPLAFAEQRILLMLVEDVQWIDPTTLELLSLLVERLPALRLFLLCTARAPFPSPWPLNDSVTTLELERLSQLESQQLVARTARGKALPASVMADIVARTDGVPLFIEELTKTILESDALEEWDDRYELAAAAPALPVPTTLHDSLAARLDRLGGAKRVAQVAAMLGREFSHAVLSAVASMDATALERDLARLIDAEFLYLRPDSNERTYIFKHALIQEAAYQSLLRSTRQRYHGRIADVIIGDFAREAAVHPEIVAMHYTEAARPDAAVHWWQQAGQQAVRRASYAEAVSHYTRGLAVLGAMAESEARDQAEIGLQLELGYALIPQQGWAAAETAQAFSRAGELSQRIGDAPKRFRALWGLSAFHFVRGDQHAARGVAEQCLTVARTGKDVDALIEGHYINGIVACAAGQFAEGIDHLEQSIRLHGDERRDTHWLRYAQDAKASALGWLALALWSSGEPDQALARAREALARVRDASQPFVRARALAAVGFVHVLRGEPEDAGSLLAEALELCAEQRYTYFHGILSAFAGMRLTQLARIDEGIALMQQSLERLRKIGSELLLTVVRADLATALAARGRIDEGLETIAEGLACVERNGEHWGEAELFRTRGELLLARSLQDTAEAEICLRNALAIATAQGAKLYWLRAATSLARLCERLGRRKEGCLLLEEALTAWPAGAAVRELDAARALSARLD